MKNRIIQFLCFWIVVGCWLGAIWFDPLTLPLFLTGLMAFVLGLLANAAEAEEKKKGGRR